MWPKTSVERDQQLGGVGCVLFFVGTLLSGVPGCMTWAIVAIVASVPFCLCSAVSLLQKGMLKASIIVISLFLFLTGGPWCHFMGRMMFGRPWKPSTDAYAQFHVFSNAATLRFDLPPGWRTQYRGRNRHQPHEGYLVDEEGRVRFDVYAGSFHPAFRQDTVEGFAEHQIAAWQELKDPEAPDVALVLVDHEFREGPTGKVWLARYRVRERGYGGRSWGEQPVMRTAYHTKFGPDLLAVEFHMLAAEVGELEPLSWTLFQTARLEGANFPPCCPTTGGSNDGQ